MIFFKPTQQVRTSAHILVQRSVPVCRKLPRLDSCSGCPQDSGEAVSSLKPKSCKGLRKNWLELEQPVEA